MLYASVTRVTKKNVCNFHPGQRIDQFNTRLLIFSTIFPSSLLLLPFHRGDTSLRLNDRNMLMRGGHLEGGKLEIRRIYIYPLPSRSEYCFESIWEIVSLILARESKYGNNSCPRFVQIKLILFRDLYRKG